MRLFFLLIPFLGFSQSVFDLKTEPIYIDAKTIDDIRNFTLDSIPPYIYTSIPDLSTLDVATRKKKFIQLILPSIIFAKSKIKKAYNNINTESLRFLYHYCNCTSQEEVLMCLSDQPNSIIIAQAAIESGWGTSRFFREGSNLFGIHSYSSNDNKLKAQGSNASSPIFVKKYHDILSSISDYLRTLARHAAYKDFRIQRFKKNNVIDLLKYLIKYSERRELYINDIETVINYNNLFIYDNIKINYE